MFAPDGRKNHWTTSVPAPGAETVSVTPPPARIVPIFWSWVGGESCEERTCRICDVVGVGFEAGWVVGVDTGVVVWPEPALPPVAAPVPAPALFPEPVPLSVPGASTV